MLSMKTIQFYNNIEKETAKAVYLSLRCLSFKGMTTKQEHWLPKSQLVITEQTIDVPVWLLKEQLTKIHKLPRDKWIKVYSDTNSMFLSVIS